MLKYRHINQLASANHRIKQGRTYYDPAYEPASDRVIIFTLGDHPDKDSLHNIDYLLSVSKQFGVELLVVKADHLQFAGYSIAMSDLENKLLPTELVSEHSRYLSEELNRSSQKHLWHNEETKYGVLCEMKSRWDWLCVPKHQGIYRVSDGRRITNRQEIIESFWQYGFAARRGRPLTIAGQRWVGDRDEIEHISNLEQQYRLRDRRSEIANRIVNTYRSLIRYAAWPGHW